MSFRLEIKYYDRREEKCQPRQCPLLQMRGAILPNHSYPEEQDSSQAFKWLSQEMEFQPFGRGHTKTVLCYVGSRPFACGRMEITFKKTF